MNNSKKNTEKVLDNNLIWKNLFSNPKDYKASFKFILIFLISLLICYFISSFFSGDLYIPINVSELPSGIGQSFPFSIASIIELIAMGPIFSIIFYILIKLLINKIDKNHGKNKYWIFIIEIISVITIGVLVAGHFIHLTYNYASHLYDVQHGGYETTELFLLLYWADEWLGHHMIHIAFFSQIVLALSATYLIKNKRMMKWDEVVLSIFLGFGLFIVMGFASYEGQCAALLMILCLILLVIEVIFILIKKINPLRNSILLVSIISNIIVIGFYFFWIGSYGQKSYYPFIYQPSELPFSFDIMDHILLLMFFLPVIYFSTLAIEILRRYVKNKKIEGK